MFNYFPSDEDFGPLRRALYLSDEELNVDF